MKSTMVIALIVGLKLASKKCKSITSGPQFLVHLQPDLDNDRPGNLMPSCRKCNSCKRAWRPEMFRKEMAMQVDRLRRNAQFDRALRFEQIKIQESPIVFYFEREEK